MGAIETVKELAYMIQKLDNVGLLKQLVSLQEQVYGLAEENRALKEQLSTREKLTFKNNAYWLDNQGPYCSNCWDGEHKLIRLHARKGFHPLCPKCDRVAPDPDEGIAIA